MVTCYSNDCHCTRSLIKPAFQITKHDVYCILMIMIYNTRINIINNYYNHRIFNVLITIICIKYCQNTSSPIITQKVPKYVTNSLEEYSFKYKCIIRVLWRRYVHTYCIVYYYFMNSILIYYLNYIFMDSVTFCFGRCSVFHI